MLQKMLMLQRENSNFRLHDATRTSFTGGLTYRPWDVFNYYFSYYNYITDGGSHNSVLQILLKFNYIA